MAVVKTMHESNGVTNGVTNGHTPIELWRHPDHRSTRMWGFKDTINTKYGLNLQTYDELYRWSIENIPQFWAETWSFCGVKASQPFKKVGTFAFGHVIGLSPSFH
jgi:acetoacetyl-CoA synthetase